MRITLLGAGHIGQTIARLLGTSGDYDLTVVDRSATSLARLCLLYTSPSPRDRTRSRMPSSA